MSENGSKRILLVEDNELNREIASMLLMDAGYEVDEAFDGQIAVDIMEKVEEGYYRIILMDIQMPNMDGYEATRRIRSIPNEKISSIPIIAVTANAFEEDKQKAFESGMNAHVSKPIDVKVLIHTIEEYI